MSMARIQSVKSARKPQGNCGKCGDPINVGDPYIWWQASRFTYKQRRCTKAVCRPKMSELESSALADVYAAIESAEESLATAGPWDAESEAESDIQSIFDEVIDAINEVVSTYREADEAFGGGGSTVSGERADDLESAVGEIESFSLSTGDPDACDDHDDITDGCDACALKVDEWNDNVKAEAEDALSNVGVG